MNWTELLFKIGMTAIETYCQNAVYSPGRPTKFDPYENKGKEPPKAPGEYRILDDDGKIKYIGEANDLNRRMKEHMRSGKCAEGNTFAYKLADPNSTSAERRIHERQKIAQHHPYLNKSKGGEGRLAQE